MNQPRFSIIICNCNYGRFIGQALESCLAQDYPADLFETVVVDDGSTDESREVIRRFAERPGVAVIEQENRGQAAAFEAGLARARHELVCFLDADDVFLPGKLAAAARAIERLAPLPEHFFLCHDVELHDAAADCTLPETWFRLRGIPPMAAMLDIDAVTQDFPYVVPCGQVMSAATARAVLAAAPAWDWRQGADSLLAHGAMLMTGAVHYLPEVRARYRLHGANHFGAVRDGRFSPKPLWIARLPKLLHCLERFIDALPLDEAQRASRIAYTKRIERQGRAASRVQRHAEPLMTFVIDAPEADPDIVATVDACLAQTHDKAEVVLLVPAGEPGPCLPVRVRDRTRVVTVDCEASQLQRCTAGYQQARGDYLAFLAPGDLPDPVFAERHLYVQRFMGSSALSSCDIRVVNRARVLLHSGVFAGSGLWRQPLQMMPPFAAPLADWAFPPLPANVFRRSSLLDALFDAATTQDPGELADLVAWLLPQFAHSLAGSLRINECLLSIRVDDALEASYGHFSEPLDAWRAPVAPDVAATAEVCFAAFCAAHAEFERLQPRAWRTRFVAWLKDRQAPEVLARLRMLARGAPSPEPAALLEG